MQNNCNRGATNEIKGDILIHIDSHSCVRLKGTGDPKYEICIGGEDL